jgi:hypothetical protein
LGAVREPEQVKLFVGMLAGKPEWFAEAEGRLVAAFGPADLASDVMTFDFTDYYRDEMGERLKRKFLAFDRLIRPDDAAAIKRTTNDIEAELSGGIKDGPRRPVNLDPGYLSLSKVVLMTTKDAAHRLYLGRGIYAEATLCFRGGRCEPWPWTYPDYRSVEYGGFFLSARNRLKEQTRGLDAPQQ